MLVRALLVVGSAWLVFLAGCGNGTADQELTLQDYFAQLDLAFEDAVGDAEASDSLAVLADPNTEWEDGRAAIEEFVRIMRGFLLRLHRIDPPNATAQLHNQYSESLTEMVELFAEVANQPTEMEASLYAERESARLLSAAFRSASTCEELNVVAQEQRIAITLHCTAFSLQR